MSDGTYEGHEAEDVQYETEGYEGQEEYVDSKAQRRAAKYAHLRANVPLRRTGYGWFIFLAITIFLVSVADIVFLDSMLKWGVIGVLAVILIWAIILLFSRRWKEVEEGDDFDEVDYQENGDYLRCRTCYHVFRFDMDHVTDDHREHVAFNCPECGAMGNLPAANMPKVNAPVPGGDIHATDFSCGACEAHWTVGAIGHDGKADVGFEACPHCGGKDQIFQS